MNEAPANLQQIPTMYADGFNGGCGPTDMEFIFVLRGAPMIRLILPHATTKQLHAGIGDMLTKFEADSGEKAPLLSELMKRLQTANPQGAGPNKPIILTDFHHRPSSR